MQRPAPHRSRPLIRSRLLDQSGQHKLLKGAGRTSPAVLLLLTALLLGIACNGQEEISLESAADLRSSAQQRILERTVTRHGPPEYKEGTPGGRWVSSLTSDPKTFNTLTARDADSRAVVDQLYMYLADYDPYTREFKPELADFEILANEAEDKLTVIYNLRQDLYWTTPDGSVREQVTADDVVFWYDEIDGDRNLQLPGYASQFVEMPDGSSRRIEIEKLSRFSLAFHFPRIIAEPILSTNMHFGPRFVFEAAKNKDGVEGLLNTHDVSTRVTSIPSIGPFHITEYSPGVRVVLTRNPWHHKQDNFGNNIPYIEEIVYRIVPDKNTEYLLFTNGTRDSYSVRPEDLDELLAIRNPDFSIYNGGEALGSGFYTFNQNKSAMDPVKYSWFSQREFRQAMSSLLNRPRVARQVYRGLATPAHHFFATANPMFDPDIKLHYSYNPQKAIELLESIGITRNWRGQMRDSEGNHVEFTINIGAENNMAIDIANIFADELKQVGITAHVRPIDFQRIVEMLTQTYDWDCVNVALGANYWPSGGSNVWQSSGNFHLWHPLQETPATPWEARIDYLYNEGRFTLDPARRKEIYDEYQRIILEELPLFYIVYPLSLNAIRDKWDNVYFDTLGGTDINYLFLKQP